MNRSWTQYLVWLALLLPLAALAKVPERPVPPRLVNDLAGILTPAQAQELEDSLVRFDQETSTQVAVVILPDLGGYDPADMAYRIGESWGVGRQGKNNGIVVLVKPKTPSERGEVYISV
nr:TPM domain-containing protein [Prolixibacteraceae bacterium]